MARAIFIMALIGVSLSCLQAQDTRLVIDGKITLSDDGTTPIAGTVRFNASTQDFEGYTGSEWKSMTYKPTVYSYEQVGNFQFTDRDTIITFPDSLTIEEPGDYMCYFEVTFGGLVGNTTSLSSDRIVVAYFHTYNLNGLKTIGPNIVGLPAGFTYYFREQETLQFHRRFNFTVPDSQMFIRIDVRKNPCCAPQSGNIYIGNVRMHAVKIN